MNVLILPVGRIGQCRALVPRLADAFRSSSGANARVRALCDPAASWNGERDRMRLADAVERYSGTVQVFVRCLGDGALSNAALAQTPDVLVRRRAFWGDDAWRNLELWLRERFDAKEPAWRTGASAELARVVQDFEHGPAANFIDIASSEWLRSQDLPIDDDAEQRRLQAQVAPLIGSIDGGDPDRAEQASQRVRDILARKYPRD